MNLLSRMPIRYQLRLIVMILALPVVVIIINAGIQQRKESMNVAWKDTQILVDRISDEQDHIVTSSRQLMASLSQLPEIKRKNVAKVTRLLSDIHKVNPNLTNIFVADRSGTVWATAVPTRLPFIISDRRYFINALASGQLSSGEYVVSRVTNRPTFNLGYPIKDEQGSIIGVICVGFSLEKYSLILERSKLPNKASFVLLDHKGVFLFRAIEPEKFIGKQSDPALFKQVQEAPDDSTIVGTAMSTRDDRIISSKKLRLEGEPSPYMYVRVGIPVNSALKNANAQLLRNLMFFGFVLLLAYLFSSYIGERSIVARIALLDKASLYLANGAHQIKVADLVKGGELGRLAKSFDSMANTLIQRENALQKSEERFRAFVENANDTVFTLSTEGVFVYVSPNWKDAFGYELTETVGKSFESFVHPNDAANFFAFLQMIVMSGEKQSNVEYRVLHKNGTWIWYSANGSILQDPESNEVVLLGIGRDITVRKQVENELQKKNVEIEQFIYTVSHDLRSPLVTVKTFMGYLEKDMAESNQEQLSQDIQFIHSAADKMKLLLDELVEMSRIGRVETLSVEVTFKEVTDEVLGALAGVISERRVGIQRSDTDLMLFGDRQRLCQIWQNLIENAIKYRRDGSMPRIELGIQQMSGDPVFFVKDNGIGIEPQYHDKIFGIFEKLNPKSPGAGLGLSMIKRIVEKCGGRVWVESEGNGKGSCFFFTLPNAVVQS
jgi:PAS domain S-box-containing protein